MTTESLAGEICKTGHSGRVYIFGFGWACRFNLESIYGEGLLGANDEKDSIRLISNVLMCGLKTKSANNLPADFGRKDMYDLLDDIGEKGVEEVWEVAQQSMGFFDRLLGIDRAAIERLKQLALQNVALDVEKPAQPTGTDSNG